MLYFIREPITPKNLSQNFKHLYTQCKQNYVDFFEANQNKRKRKINEK